MFAEKAHASKNMISFFKGYKSDPTQRKKINHWPKYKKSRTANGQVYSVQVQCDFGVLKLHHGISKARYLGMQRYKTRFMLTAIAYNIKSGGHIKAKMGS